jgi:RHS repeat-associated protein
VNYIRTLNIDEPLARITSDGTIRYYHADALGSIIALTDDLGNVKTQYNYSPFGETDLIGEPSDNPFQYTGRENDGTGLYYYRARYYSPVLRRFVSEDPIRLKGGINFFIYASNNPILFIDIFGLFCVQLGCDYGPLRELKKEKGEWYLYKAFFEGPEKGSLVPIMYLNCWWKRKVIITYGYIETCTFQCWSECGQQSIRTISRLKTFTVETTENTFTGQGFDAFLGSVVYPDPVSWCLIYLKPIG